MSEDQEFVWGWIARCPYCPISAKWDSGYHFIEGTPKRLYLLHLQSKHPARYHKLMKRRAETRE